MANLPYRNQLIRQLSESLKATNLKDFLEHSLATIGEVMNARGCSVLVVFNRPLSVKWGKIAPRALSQIEAWEARIRDQLRQGVWTAHWVDSPPVNELTLPETDVKILNMPLAAQRKVIGSLSLIVDSDFTLSPQDAQTLTSLTKWVAEAAALYRRLEIAYDRLRHLELFFQIGQHMVSTFDLNELLMDTMEVANLILDAMAASLMLIKEETQELVMEMVYGEEGETVRMVKSKLGEGIVGWVAEHGKPLLINDVQKDPRFNPKVDARTGVLTKSIVCVPLQIKGKTIGVLEVINKRSGDGFDEEDLKLLSTIAAQAAIAIENAKLYQSLKEEKDRLIQVQEEVRRELARNLHDSTVQFLSAISMGLDHLERLLEIKPEAVKAELEALRRMTKQAIKETRLLLFELRPLILESQGLIPALKSYVEQLNNTEAFQVKLEAEEFKGPFKRTVERTLFSIIQEAITNVKKHAQAKNVWIKIFSEDNSVVVQITDDGTGFDLKEVMEKYEERGSLGLVNMQERAKLIGAQLSIDSRTTGPNHGTTVTVRIPEAQAFELRKEGQD
ncbi:MAG: hypothetical protein DRI61_03500 [Chloroflexi bacterium]|nr:MAG: hypothetical protein DRI61_03500 [Chloroflexota bacterium]HDN79136.1 GAF domain-containing protein [Chloroflexota bacterium]